MIRRSAVVGPLAAALTVFAAAAAGPAQQTQPAPAAADPTAQQVSILTADGVDLVGTYFRSPRGGRDTPCVLMVHSYASDRSKADWISLARALQAENFAVLTFDLRGHGQSTQLNNPQAFWNFAFNRDGIRGGTANIKKTAISVNDFKPSYFPFLVNDVAAARRFFEQKNDAGEVNVHSLIVLGAQEGAGLGFLFTAAEYGRVYRIGQNALQSYGTEYNAGADIAAGVWLSLVIRPNLPAGTGLAPNMDMPAWIRSHPMMRDKTPMCFLFGEKDTRAKADAETVFRAMTAKMSGRPEKHKLDDLHPIRGTNLAGSALLGQPALQVSPYVVGYVKKVMADRRAIPWTDVKPEVNTLQIVPVNLFGIRVP
ncbi:MAG TPA: alpha/beta fold hydrolase [Gemmataceae bacterium]|jgi:pimeloyl-ACP methyl ester carboxylesterase